MSKNDTNTISARELSELTGLSDRRHRQLAKEGIIPMPTEGKYPRRETIKALFAYFRTAHQASARTLIQAKLKKLESETQLIDLKIAEEEHRLVDAAAMTEAIGKCFTALVAEIQGMGYLEAEDKAKLVNHLRHTVEAIAQAGMAGERQLTAASD